MAVEEYYKRSFPSFPFLADPAAAPRFPSLSETRCHSRFDRRREGNQRPLIGPFRIFFSSLIGRPETGERSGRVMDHYCYVAVIFWQ